MKLRCYPVGDRQNAGLVYVFTLIELLVVVAIIGILASMLLPVLSRARGQAKIASDHSQQRQSYLALQIYGDDYQEYPCVVDWNGPLDWQGKPSVWNGDAGSGKGNPAWQLLESLKYLSDPAIAKGPTTPPSGATHSAGNKNIYQNYYHYISPDTCGSGLVQYGHGSRLSKRTGLYHRNDWSRSPRGWRYNDGRTPEAFGLMSTKGYLNRDAGHNGVITWEPHLEQPIPVVGGAHQNDKWDLNVIRRVYTYADGHSQWETTTP